MAIRKPTIGLVLNNTPTYSETFFLNKIKFLQEEGYRVILFAKKATACPNDWKVVTPYPTPKNAGIKGVYVFLTFLCLLLRAPSRIFNFIKLEKEVRNNWRTIIENIYINAHILTRKVDWLHFGFATIALRRENVAAAIGAKMAVSIRGYDIDVFPLKNPMCYHLLWKRVDKVHTISTYLINKAYDLGLSICKPFSRITPAVRMTDFLLEKNDEMKERINILTIARLAWIKGILYALHAMRILKDAGLDFKYTILGDGPEKHNLVFAANQLGISDNVIFVGKVDKSDIPSYLSKHSLYLQPSISEGFCNAVLEAQVAGLFCVVTDGGALPENILHQHTGWIVPKRDPNAIANAIFEILNMSLEVREKILKTAVERVQKEFNLQKQEKEFIEFYK